MSYKTTYYIHFFFRVYSESRSCMINNTFGCSDDQRRSIKKSFEDIQCLIGDICPIIEDKPAVGVVSKCIDPAVIAENSNNSCSVRDAFGCFRDVYYYFSNPYMSKNTLCV